MVDGIDTKGKIVQTGSQRDSMAHYASDNRQCMCSSGKASVNFVEVPDVLFPGDTAFLVPDLDCPKRSNANVIETPQVSHCDNALIGAGKIFSGCTQTQSLLNADSGFVDDIGCAQLLLRERNSRQCEKVKDEQSEQYSVHAPLRVKPREYFYFLNCRPWRFWTKDRKFVQVLIWNISYHIQRLQNNAIFYHSIADNMSILMLEKYRSRLANDPYNLRKLRSSSFAPLSLHNKPDHPLNHSMKRVDKMLADIKIRLCRENEEAIEILNLYKPRQHSNKNKHHQDLHHIETLHEKQFELKKISKFLVSEVLREILRIDEVLRDQFVCLSKSTLNSRK